jgi:uncharacterized Zn-binding protein involved in type VI secretion
MAHRRFILLGDKTSHGGTVVTARGAGPVPFLVDGIPVACVGDQVTCPRCKGTHYITTGGDDPPMYLGNVLIATENCKVSDGSYLISVQQQHATHGPDSNGASQAAIRNAAAPFIQLPWAAPGKGFCLECWLKAASQRNAMMRNFMS